MAKPKNRKPPKPAKAELPARPWPAYESPERIRYDDRPELPEDVYRETGRHFTPAAFEKVKAALDPPKNFGLLKRLQRATFDYHLFTAAQAGRVDLITLNRPETQARALKKLITQTGDYLQFCEENPGAFLEVADPPEDWIVLLALLRSFKRKAETAREKIELGGGGRPRDMARRAYQTYLLKIYEEAKGEPMTSRTGQETHRNNEPYGPAFNFFSAAFLLIGANLAQNSFNKYLKDTIQKRENIITSKLFKK
jgi:hypothetical protein